MESLKRRLEVSEWRDIKWHDGRTESLWTYALVCPRDEEVRYVGSTCRPLPRLKEHIRCPVNLRMAEWVASLKRARLAPYMIILEIEPYTRSAELEVKWLWYYRDRIGDRLLNGWVPPDDYFDDAEDSGLAEAAEAAVSVYEWI